MLWIMISVPQFCDNKDFFSFQFACCNFLIYRFSDLGFVLISIGGVNVTITVLKSEFSCVIAVIVGALKINVKWLLADN